MTTNDHHKGYPSQRHAAVLASALDAIITIDGQGVILEFNPSASQTFGWSQTEAVGQRLSDLIIPERYREAHIQGMKHYAKTGEGPVLGTRIEIEALHRDGREFPIELAITPIITEQGTVFTALIRDLTKAKELNRELSVASFTIEQSSDAIYWIDETARIINCNPAAATSLGYTREQLIGKLLIEIDPNMTTDGWAQHWKDLRKHGSVQLETEHTRFDGATFPVEVNANYIVHEGAEFNCAFARDITLRKENQRRIFESSQRLELVLGAAEIGFWDWNILTGDKVVNEEYLMLCGVTHAEFSPDPEWFKERIHPDDFEQAYKRVLAHFEGKIDRIDSQYRIRQGDDSWRWVHDRGRVVERDSDGNAVRAMGAMQDVTQRSEATEALKISEQRFRDVVSSVGEFIWEADNQLGLVYVSETFTRNTGIDRANIIDSSMVKLTDTEHEPSLLSAFQTCLDTNEPVRGLEFPVRKGEDATIWIRLNAQPFYAGDGAHIGFRGTGLDITFERAAEQAKRRSDELQKISRAIVMDLLEPGDLSDNIDQLVQRVGQFLGAQRVYLLRLDESLSTVLCSSSWFAPDLTDPDLRFPLRTASVSPAMLAGIDPSNPVVLNSKTDTLPAWMQQDTQEHLGLPVIIGGSAASYIGIDWTGSFNQISDVDRGVLMGIASSLGHTIERRVTKRELELSAMRLANEARRAEQASEAKSAFLAHMSHELRTPITAVLGSSEILASGNCSPERQERLLRSILSNGRSLLAHINSVLDLSRYERGETPVRIEPTSILQIIDQVRSSVMPLAMLNGVQVIFSTATRIPAEILCDHFQLTQLLVNLITNSVKYAQTDEVQVTFGINGSTTRELIIEVKDRGVGIPADLLDRLFEPFERGEDQSAPGTGLGLAICKRIIDALGGTITCDSQPRVETRFTCVIPFSPYGNDIIEPGVIEAEDAGPGAHILDTSQLEGVRALLAEDSPHVREVITYFLTDRGASVETVVNGARAVETINARGSDFNIILMDMQMPEMDGYEAAGKLKEMGVKTPIIALTAHGLAEDRAKCLEAGCDDYLSKPVSPDLLAVSIQRAIGIGPAESDAPHTRTNAAPARNTPSTPPDDLVARYREHLRQECEKFSLTRTDMPELRKLLHQVKGTSATMGLQEVSELAAAAERAIKAEERIDSIEEKLRAFRTQIME